MLLTLNYFCLFFHCSGRDLTLVSVSHALRAVPIEQHLEVGLALGVELEQIHVFEANYPRDIQRVWKEILQYWLNCSSSHSWTGLALTLMKNLQTQYAQEFSVLE